MTDPSPSRPPARPPLSGPGDLDRALDLVRFLRAHCPWDGEQTARSLVPHLLEETHEVVEAIREGRHDELEGELGDLLLNLAFQVVVAEEEGRLDAASVYERLERKMMARHPHLFGEGAGGEPGARAGAARAWEARKAAERPPGKSVVDGLPTGLDPLTRAHRIQERVAGVGFDWPDHRGALEKVAEELDEVRGALEARGAEPVETPVAEPVEALGATPVEAPGNAPRKRGEDAIEEELGDLLFAVVNLARLAGEHATPALSRANRKFVERFTALERLARERGIVLHEAGLEALDVLWEEVKRG